MCARRMLVESRVVAYIALNRRPSKESLENGQGIAFGFQYKSKMLARRDRFDAIGLS